jgi:Sec-independent protein secretion pathway component TatC
VVTVASAVVTMTTMTVTTMTVTTTTVNFYNIAIVLGKWLRIYSIQRCACAKQENSAYNK